MLLSRQYIEGQPSGPSRRVSITILCEMALSQWSSLYLFQQMCRWVNILFWQPIPNQVPMEKATLSKLRQTVRESASTSQREENFFTRAALLPSGISLIRGWRRESSVSLYTPWKAEPPWLRLPEDTPQYPLRGRWKKPGPLISPFPQGSPVTTVLLWPTIRTQWVPAIPLQSDP